MFRLKNLSVCFFQFYFLLPFDYQMFLISHFSLVSISCQLPGCLCASWAQRNDISLFLYWIHCVCFFFLFTFSFQIPFQIFSMYGLTPEMHWTWLWLLGCLPVCSVPPLAFHSMLFKIGLFLWELHYAVQERGKRQLGCLLKYWVVVRDSTPFWATLNITWCRY